MVGPMVRSSSLWALIPAIQCLKSLVRELLIKLVLLGLLLREHGIQAESIEYSYIAYIQGLRSEMMPCASLSSENAKDKQYTNTQLILLEFHAPSKVTRVIPV